MSDVILKSGLLESLKDEAVFRVVVYFLFFFALLMITDYMRRNEEMTTGRIFLNLLMAALASALAYAVVLWLS